jgi:hypothetical protein
MLSLFGSAYIFEHFSSKINIVKYPPRNRLDGERLKRGLHVATSQISPDINIFVTNKQFQFSNSSYLFLNNNEQ